MQLKLFLLLCYLLLSTLLWAQDTAGNKKIIPHDSGQIVLKTSDGKIVTIGKPVSVKTLTGKDKVEMFSRALYDKYPVWCWIAGIFLLLSAVRLLKWFFTR